MNEHPPIQEIDYLVNGFINLATGLANLSRNPALPEMLRQEFSALVEGVSHVHACVSSDRNQRTFNGYGPRSIALKDVQRWVKPYVAGDVDLANLAVKGKWEWSEEPQNVPDDEYFLRYWSQFFYTAYPLEVFTDKDSTVKTTFTRDGLNYTVVATADLATKTTPGADEPEESFKAMVHLKYVTVHYQPPEGFYAASATFYTNSCLFETPVPSIFAFHHVEGHSANGSVNGVTPLLMDYAIKPLEGILGFVFEDYQLSPELGVVHDCEADITEISSHYPEHHILPAKDKMIAACNPYRGADGLIINVDGVGVLRLKTGDRDWRSYEEFVKKRDSQTWYKDKPVVEIDVIKAAGASVEKCRLPVEWVDKINVAIYDGLKKVCTDSTSWPLSPEEKQVKQQAEYDKLQAKPID